MSNEKLLELLGTANRELKSGGIKLAIAVSSDRLYIRGTFPAKPADLAKVSRKQYRIKTGYELSPYGIREAKSLALLIWSKILGRTFDWSDYIDTSTQDSCGAWIDRYREHCIKNVIKPYSGRDPNVYFRTAFFNPVLKLLPKDKPLTPEILIEAAQQKAAHTRSRKLAVGILVTFAKFCAIDVDLKQYSGRYSSRDSAKRIIPTDQQVIDNREKFFVSKAGRAWLKIYDLMAIYGLRDRECYFCEIDPNPPHYVSVLAGKTGGRNNVRPLYPEWAEQWRPWEGVVPEIPTAGDLCAYGQRTSKRFKDFGVEFPPYSLRHAWCLRGSVTLGISIATMARMAGHSESMHLQTYHRWISADMMERDYQEKIASRQKSFHDQPSLEFL